MDVMQLLGSALTQDNIHQIAGSLGVSEGQTRSAVAMAIPALVGALAKNASKPDGAEALAGALDKDHDGSVFNNLGSLIAAPQENGSGAGILGHVLGNSQPKVEEEVSSQTGLASPAVQQLMITLAPMVLGSLGKAKKDAGMDAKGVAQALEASKEPDTMTRLFDRDGDGDYSKELVGLGSSLIGKLF